MDIQKWIKNLIIIVLVVLTLVGAYGSFYYYKQYQLLNQNPELAQQLAAEKETKELTLALGKLMELPADEIPIIYTIFNKDDLKGQAFFKNAENGDKLMVYTKMGKAILYRPSTNKIVEVAPASISQPTGGDEQNAADIKK